MFVFTHNSSYKTQYTWAFRVIPSEVQFTVCPVCKAVFERPSGPFDVEVEGGNQYPDVLGCGAYPFLIVSGRVVDDWHMAEVSDFSYQPVRVVASSPDAPALSYAPAYFWVEPKGSCQIDLDASGIEIVSRGTNCGKLMTVPAVPTKFKLVTGSWDGSQVFRDKDLFPYLNFCTHNIISLAQKHRHTNFRFEAIEGPLDPFSEGISY